MGSSNGDIARLPIKCQTTTPFPIVGALGILMMIWISVGERVSEIGLLHAMGAKPRPIFVIFIVESVMLSVPGGASWGVPRNVGSIFFNVGRSRLASPRGLTVSDVGPIGGNGHRIVIRRSACMPRHPH